MPRTPTPHTQYRHQSNRHTNVPDYEKERRVPEDRYSPPGRDVGLWVEEEYTMRRGRSSANTSPRQADHDMPYTTLSDNTTPTSRNPGLNIWTEASKTSPTSNLETASYHTKRISPQEKSRSPILLPDDIYDRHRTEGDNRRDTLCYEEPRIFKPLPSTNDDTVSCRSLPCSAYSVPRLAKDNSDNASLDNYLSSRYSQNASGSFSSSQLRKSHQELTDETMRHHTPSHHRSPSLRSVNEQLRGGDPYRSLVPPHDHMTYLQANRQSHSTSDLVTSRTPTSMSDLSTWQQLHKQQLALQKADTKTLSSMNSKSASLNNLHGFDPVSVPNIAGVYNNHHTIGAFRNAADEIIQEKDKVIEDLRIQLMQLEGSSHYPSGYSSLPLRSPGGTEISQLKQHVQDLEFQNSLLKSRLDEISKSQKSNIKSLELKLGATEHELMSVKSDLSSKQKRSRFESVEVEQKLMEKDNEIQEWQRRYVEMRDDRTEVKRKLDGLQRYLSDLPTAEDSSATKRHVAELEEKVSTQTTTIEGLEKKLMTTNKVKSSQALELKNLEKQKSELTNQLSTVQEELNTIKTNGLGEELASAQHQIGQLKRDKDRVKIELEKSKKMLGDRHQLAKRAEMRHQLEVKKLEERVQQEESVVTALREESSNNEAHMAKLKQAIKELSTQNQDLMEQTMIQQESLAKFDRQCTEESQKVERQLAREMRQCFAELQSLVRVCMDRAEGNDPDINLVLGTGGMPEVESDDEYSQSSQSGSSSQASSNSGRGALTDALTLKHRLTKVRELRGDVDKLRAVISDKIAADLGKRIECAMQ